jgi:hypothetical protein
MTLLLLVRIAKAGVFASGRGRSLQRRRHGHSREGADLVWSLISRGKDSVEHGVEDFTSKGSRVDNLPKWTIAFSHIRSSLDPLSHLATSQDVEKCPSSLDCKRVPLNRAGLWGSSPIQCGLATPALVWIARPEVIASPNH